MAESCSTALKLKVGSLKRVHGIRNGPWLVSKKNVDRRREKNFGDVTILETSHTTRQSSRTELLALFRCFLLFPFVALRMTWQSSNCSCRAVKQGARRERRGTKLQPSLALQLLTSKLLWPTLESRCYHQSKKLWQSSFHTCLLGTESKPAYDSCDLHHPWGIFTIQSLFI